MISIEKNKIIIDNLQIKEFQKKSCIRITLFYIKFTSSNYTTKTK